MFVNNSFKDSETYDISVNISNMLEHLSPLELLEIVIEKFNFYNHIIKIGNIAQSLTQLDYYINLSEEIITPGYDSFKFIDYLKELLIEQEQSTCSSRSVG